MDWDDYEPYAPGISGPPPNDLPRGEARKAFKHRMETKAARVEVLGRLLKANNVHLDTTDAAVQDLNDWFVENIEPDPEAPGRPRPIWFSVCQDIALFLGDVMIERSSTLCWEFFIWGKKNVAYQHHVIMGMSTEDPKYHTNIDIERMVVAYAHRVVQSKGSIPTYGTVDVRGAKIDVDAIAADHRARGFDPQEFWGYLRMAARRA